MAESFQAPTPQHREKLLDLHTDTSLSTNPARLDVAACTASPIPPGEQTVHVNPVGRNWEVESASGTLGQAGTKHEAEELATALGKDLGAEKVAVHTSDGRVEKEIPLNASTHAEP